MIGIGSGMFRIVGVVSLLAFNFVLWAIHGTGTEVQSWLLLALIVVCGLEALGTAVLMIANGGFWPPALVLWILILGLGYAAAGGGPVFWIAAAMAVGPHLLCLTAAIVVLAFEAACDRVEALAQRASDFAAGKPEGEGPE